MAFWKSRGKEEKKSKRRLILAIDGGGIRGIIPAYILKMLNRQLKAEGDQRPLYSHFDLIAGTSTGALIASALSIPTEGTKLPAEKGPDIPVYDEETIRHFFRKITYRWKKGDISQSSDPESFPSFYIDNGPRIFPQKGMGAIFGQIFSDKYSASGYELFLQELYGNRRMKELMVPTVIVSYSTDLGMIYPITSWENGEFKLWEAARASSAAPLYFPVFTKETGSNGKIHLIDGGIAANNPSLIAYSLARKLYPDTDKFCILSLSTCAPIYRSSQEKDQGGLTGWGSQISKVFQNAQSDLADTVLEAIPGVEYTRIWAPVLDRKIRLDETGKETIDILTGAARRLQEEKKDDLTKWAKLLASSPTAERTRLRVPKQLSSPHPEEGSGAGGG